jgi:CheY-like chemotaxis protein
LRVLAVEDNADSRDMTRTMLELNGHEVRAVPDGAQGIEEAASWKPDVILLDIGLPGMDGYEIARRLRANPALTGTRIIALTGYGQADDARRAFAAGFDMHLTKPVEPEALEEALAASSSQAQAS